MTEIAFHFNLPERIGYVCRLLRKAVGQGARIHVTGPQPLLDEIDLALWSVSETDFIPHGRIDDAAVVRDASPVLLDVGTETALHHEVLLNLHPEVPAGFEQFARVIEVVGGDAAEVRQARERWKHYQRRGYPIVRHDLGQKGRA